MSTELQNNPMELTLPPLQSPDLLTPPATQNTRSPPWPQSEHGDTPPRITPTNFRNESPTLPPRSPSDYPRTVANTPRQPPLPELDPDITMTAPQPPQGSMITNLRTPLVRTPTIRQPTPAPNYLGLNVQPGTPETPPTKQTLLNTWRK